MKIKIFVVVSCCVLLKSATAQDNSDDHDDLAITLKQKIALDKVKSQDTLGNPDTQIGLLILEFVNCFVI